LFRFIPQLFNNNHLIVTLMKTTSMIALIAVISAASIGAISMNGFSAIPFATASVSPESGTMMGHVETILRDANGNIKLYSQGDNIVTNKGDDCTIAYAFQTSAAGGADNCTGITADGFRFIGIGNATTFVPGNGDTTLVTGGALTVATRGAAATNGGIMAVRADSDTVGTASSSGGNVAINNPVAFTFNSSNATTVTMAGLFDATCSGLASNGACTANGAGTMRMFSVQQLSGASGIIVAAGDSLAVTWTITVGNGS
jgi:hypothetical protein